MFASSSLAAALNRQYTDRARGALGIAADFSVLSQYQAESVGGKLAGFSQVAAELARLQQAVTGAVASSAPAIVALIHQQEGFARLAAAASPTLEERVRTRLAEDLSASAAATVAIASLAQVWDSSSLAVRQGDLLADSYRSFTSTLLEEQSGATGPELDSTVFASGSRLATSAFVAATAFLDDIAGADDGGAVGVMATRPNVYQVLHDVIDQRRPQLTLLSLDAVDRQLGESTAGRIIGAAIKIVEGRQRINQAGLRTNNAPIFHAASETEIISCMLGQQIVDDESDFDQLVDSLYKYLVESSDDLGAIKPYLAAPPVVADIITLRNYYSHDPESENEKERARKLRRVGRVLSDLAGTPVPASREQWRQAQLKLLQRILTFQDELFEKIVGSQTA